MKIKILLLCLLISSFQLNAFVNLNSDKNLKKEVQELKVRGCLPNFFSKALHGDSIKVAYFGGSITEQPGWRLYSLDWFKQRFPKAKFSEIHAAIGGTGSDLGVFRLQEHVLKFKPDMVFVEFAVNDADAPSEKIIRSMEGIVRQIWKQNPLTDICFIYTIQERFLDTEQNGQLPTSAIAMEQVADNYNIPSINFGFEVCKMVGKKQLIIKNQLKEIDGVKVFSKDGVHPYVETGHVIYTDVLKRSIETIYSEQKHKSKKHKLSKSLVRDYFSNTQMVDFSEGKLSQNWEVFKISDQKDFASFGKYLKKVGKATQNGESITIHFKGRTIGFYDFMGPDAGKVIVEIDGVVKDTISRFDAYCTYRRMNYFLIDHLENKEHTAVFKLLSEPFDKAAILAERNAVMKNPADYKENNWYVGKILIDGIILP